jgi:hypothetical protein
MLSLLGTLSGHGAFPVPREWTVLLNASQVALSARVMAGSPRGVITKESRLYGFSHARGDAGEFFVEVGANRVYGIRGAVREAGAGSHEFKQIGVKSLLGRKPSCI